MSLSVEIHPVSNTLVMLNEPDASTTYSLSGYVSVSLSSRASFLRWPYTDKVLLRFLTLTFEGKAELITKETGYSAVRLCRLSRELVPSQAMLLSIDGHEDAEMPCTWNFVFDLPIPGWLPSSSVYGSGMGGPTGTSYSFYAKAQFTSLEDGLQTRGLSLLSLCAPFIGSTGVKTQNVNAPRKEIEISRYVAPTAIDDVSSRPFMTLRNLQFLLKPRGEPRSKIPSEVFPMVELRASIPEYVDLAEESFMLTIRLRMTNLPLEHQRQLWLTQFRLNLLQDETYSRRPFRSFTSAFPLPFSQPHSEPLLNPHAMKGLFETGTAYIDFLDGPASQIRASFPFLKGKQPRRHILRNNGIPLLQPSASSQGEQAWARLDVCVPFEHILPGQDTEWEHKNYRFKALRADEESPFLRVSHHLMIELTFECYDGAEKSSPGDRPLSERMYFNIPVCFARVLSESSAVILQDVSALPVHSQLFRSDGEQRPDNPAPPPAYAPPDEAENARSIQAVDYL